MTGETALINGSGTVSYTHTCSLSDTRSLGEGYVQVDSTIDGDEYLFRRMAALVRRRLYPVVSDIDLTATYSDLDNLRPSSLSSYQQYIDDAWYQILRRIRNRGMGYEYLMMSAESFFEALDIYLSISYSETFIPLSVRVTVDIWILQTSTIVSIEMSSTRSIFVYDTDHDGGQTTRTSGPEDSRRSS